MRQSLEDSVHNPLPPFDSGSVRNLHELSFYAVLAGSTSLIPLPFLDDWAHSYVRRLLIRTIWREEALSKIQENLLYLRSRNLKTERGCVGQGLVILVVTPLRLALYVAGRIFRKIVFVLALKEAVDRAAEAFQEGFLLSLARNSCQLSEERLLNRDQKILQLSYAVEETLRESPASTLRPLVRKVFRGSYGLLFRAARSFREITGLLRQPEVHDTSGREQVFLEKEEDKLDEIVARLEAALPLEKEHLDRMARNFEGFARRRGLL